MQTSSAAALFLAIAGSLNFFGFQDHAQTSATISRAKVSVLTQRYDNARSGANLSETFLTTNTVDARANLFGKLFSVAVEGNIYAQPLYAADVDFPNRPSRDVLYVATAKNNVYAIDAATGEQIWSKRLGLSVPASDITAFARSALRKAGWDYKDIYPDIGVTATPVMDLKSSTIFIVAKTKEVSEGNAQYHYRLHALNMQTGADAQPPAEIDGSVRGTAADAKNDKVVFNSFLQLNRPGLLLVDGTLYVAFGSQGELSPFHGWVFAYQSSTIHRAALVFCTTPDKVDEPAIDNRRLNSLNGNGGGIWQSGTGLAADDHGAIYFSTGDGTWDGKRDFSNSYLKLDRQLNIVDWFTPSNHEELDNYDLDLGSGGPVLLPGQLFVGGGKDGRLFLIRRDHLGHITEQDQGIAQEIQVTKSPPASLRSCDNCFHHLHGSPVIWPSRDGLRIYIWPEMESLKAFKLVNGSLIPSGESKTSAPKPLLGVQTSMPGGMLALSANGDQAGTGIIWASIPIKENANHQNVPGVLRAFDASNVTKEIWNSEMNPGDQLGYFAKFCPPTIANGRVYMATFAAEDNSVQTGRAHIVVYGMFGKEGRKRPVEYQTTVH